MLNEQQASGWKVFIPKFEYCTDNAAMIAVTGYLKYQDKNFADQKVSPFTRYSEKK
jgi:N6-L-threonylcarbamoyladenine synthase